jgi:hypothetical protein
MATNVQDQVQSVYLTRMNFGSASAANLQGNHQGAMLVGLSMPMNTEVARMQKTFVAATATPVAPVAAMPTTASHFSLFCPQAQTVSLVIHKITAYVVASAAAVETLTLAANLTTVPVSSITGTAVTGPKGLGNTNTSIASAFSAVTTVNNGVWHTLGLSQNTGAQTANIATSLDTGDLGGLYVVQPGLHLDLAVLCSAAGSSTCNIQVIWSEIQL